MIAFWVLVGLVAVLDVAVTLKLCRQYERSGYAKGWADAYAGQFTEAGSLPNTGRSSVPAGTPDTDGKVWPHPRHAHSSEAAQQGCEPPESSYRYTTPPVRGPQGRD